MGPAKKREVRMRKAIWFSRHAVTEAQVADAASMGWEFVGGEDGIWLGGFNINSIGDLTYVFEALKGLVRKHGAEGVFGVFAVPMQGLICTAPTLGKVPCFGAWNVMRSVEGGKPTFEHKLFVEVGWLAVA